MFIPSLRVNKSPSEYSQQKGGDGRTPDPYLEPLEAGRFMYRFRWWFLLLPEKLVTDAYVLFGKDEYLPGQAVAGSRHFQLSSDMRVTFTVACPLRRLKPVPTGISSSISVGNFVSPCWAEQAAAGERTASAREAVFLAVLVPHQWLRTSAARHG